MTRLEALALTLTTIAAFVVLVLDMFVWRPL
jgi:hypothetical protein